MADTFSLIDSGTARLSYIIAQGLRYGISFDGTTSHSINYAHFYEDVAEGTISDGGSACQINYSALYPVDNIYAGKTTITASASTIATRVVLFDNQNQPWIRGIFDTQQELETDDQLIISWRGTIS